MSKRVLMWTLSTFLLTMFVGTFLSFRWMIFAASLVLIGIVPAAIVRYPVKKTVLSSMVAFLVAALFLTGAEYHTEQIENQLIMSDQAVSGEIADIGTNSAGNLLRYKIRLSVVDGEKLPFYSRYYIYLYCDTDELHLPGSKISGNFDYFDTGVEYGAGREDRIILSAYGNLSDFKFNDPDEGNLSHAFYKFRMAIQNRISFGGEKVQGLLKSVCFGETDSLDSGLNVSLRRIGLTHVTAVSGLHLSFAVLLFNFFLTLLGLHYRVRFLLDIFISIFFTAAVGFPPSCVRACVMMVLYSFGMALNLFSDSLTSLSVAAFLITIVNPYSIRDVGFLLSVCATAGIILLSLPIENFLFPKIICQNHRVNWLYRKLTSAFSCSIAATIATLPIILAVFGTVSLIGPLSNVILIYPLQWVFMMGILMVLLGWIPGFGIVLGFLCNILYFLIDIVADFLGRFTFSSISNLNLLGVVMLVLLIGILIVGLFDFYKYKHRSFVCLFLLLLCFGGLFHSIYTATHSNEFVEIAFVDVGQGDCTVISQENSAVILDYGGSSEKRYNLIEYLKKRNINTIELLAFTHLHSDHTNGLRTLLKNVYVDEILYPDLGFESDELKSMFQSENAKKIDGDTVRTVLGDVCLEIVADEVFDQALERENERCVCYRISYGETSVLVTGDLTGEMELKLLDRELDSTFLKVAHHGSATSSLYPFIKAISPEVAVISVGENSYGLPKKAVIDRFSTVSPTVLQTLHEGTIIFRTDGRVTERVLK